MSHRCVRFKAVLYAATLAMQRWRTLVGKRGAALDTGLDVCRMSLCCTAAHAVEVQMLTLYSYPELFGVADNNGFGLKVFAFLRLNGVPFRHQHVSMPRGHRAGNYRTLSMKAKRLATAILSSPISSPSYHLSAAMLPMPHTRGLADLANIYFYEVETPLKQFVASHENIVRHCRAIHDATSVAACAPLRVRSLDSFARLTPQHRGRGRSATTANRILSAGSWPPAFV
jgi:hypothetical protein